MRIPGRARLAFGVHGKTASWPRKRTYQLAENYRHYKHGLITLAQAHARLDRFVELRRLGRRFVEEAKLDLEPDEPDEPPIRKAPRGRVIIA